MGKNGIEIDMNQFRKKAKEGKGDGVSYTYAYVKAEVGTEDSDLLLEFKNAGYEVKDIMLYLLRMHKGDFDL